MLLRRINFWGGPGLGKSVAASYVFTKLKRSGYNIELVQEVAKEWAYEKKQITPWDQLSIFSSQIAREHRIVSSGNDIIIVSDSPSLLAIPYMMKYGFRFYGQCIEIAKGFELDYPSVNFYLERKDCPFNQEGRYENYEEAKMMDLSIRSFLDEHNISYIPMGYDDLGDILDIAISFIEVERGIENL